MLSDKLIYGGLALIVTLALIPFAKIAVDLIGAKFFGIPLTKEDDSQS